MISKSFKKQLIVNTYKTQLLPVMDIVGKKILFDTITRIKNVLLFRINDDLWVEYKYKNNNIDYDIHWFLRHLIGPIYSIHQYSEDKLSDIQKKILYNIKNILDKKQKIDESPDYAKYLEDVYD